MPLTKEQIDALVDTARSASDAAHCPYSRFPVGAALLDTSGRVWTGANVENASYPEGLCAERVALTHAVTHGATLDSFLAVAVWTKTPRPTSPCGACRQVMHELAPSARVISGCLTTERIDSTVASLLPAGFDKTLLPDDDDN
jgi:cytidine deaminase